MVVCRSMLPCGPGRKGMDELRMGAESSLVPSECQVYRDGAGREKAFSRRFSCDFIFLILKVTIGRACDFYQRWLVTVTSVLSIFRGKSLVVGGFGFLFVFVCVVCMCACMYDPRRVESRINTVFYLSF